MDLAQIPLFEDLAKRLGKTHGGGSFKNNVENTRLLDELTKNGSGLCADVKDQHRHEHDEDKEHFETIGDIKRSLGLITKVMNSSTKEVLGNPEARASVSAEFKQVSDTGTVVPDSLREKEDILREHPDARFVDLLILTSVKNKESDARRKYKSRGVALGNRLKNEYGKVIKEQLLRAVTASMDMIRLGATTTTTMTCL